MSDLPRIDLNAGDTEIVTLVRVFGPDLAVVRLNRGDATWDVPVQMGSAAIIDGFRDNWARRIDDSLDSGMKIAVQWAQAGDEGLPRAIILEVGGKPMDAHAVANGWAIPTDLSLEGELREDYATATLQAFRAKAGLWGDQELAPQYRAEMQEAIPEGQATWQDYGIDHRPSNILLMLIVLVLLAVRYRQQQEAAADATGEAPVGGRLSRTGKGITRVATRITGLRWLFPHRLGTKGTKRDE